LAALKKIPAVVLVNASVDGVPGCVVDERALRVIHALHVFPLARDIPEAVVHSIAGKGKAAPLEAGPVELLAFSVRLAAIGARPCDGKTLSWSPTFHMHAAAFAIIGTGGVQTSAMHGYACLVLTDFVRRKLTVEELETFVVARTVN
jgi:hypothetical protein